MRVIAGSARGRRLEGPRGRGTRPTADRVKEALFSMLGELVPEAQVLDLYAGTGALGIEALSRGAAHAFFVDHDPACAGLIHANIEATALRDRATVIVSDAFAACRDLASAGHRFDLVLADPPYGYGNAAQVLAAVGRLLSPGALVVLEHGAREELPVKAENLYKIRDRVYGSARLSLYRAEE